MTVPGKNLFPPLSSVRKVEPPPYVRRVLPNGLTILVQEDKSNPLVAFQATIRTGSATEGSYLGAGISHVVEHMLFKGTARRPVGAVEREARSYGGTSQGFTTYDTTSYQFVVNKESWFQAADLLIDAVFFSSFDPQEFIKERGVILRELKLGKDDPDHIQWELLFENAYRVHPYRVPIIGYEPVVSALTREDIVSYHKQWYVPNNIVIAVVGDVDAESVVRRIEELTAALPAGRPSAQALPAEPLQFSPREVTQEADVAVAMTAIGFPSVALADADLFALDLLARLLGGYRGSWLDHALKETGIVHAVTCWNYTPRDRGLFVISARMDAGSEGKAVEKAFEQVARVQKEFFDPLEIESAKKGLLRNYLEDRQTVAGQAGDLAGNEILLGDPLFGYRYLEGIQRVTAEDLKRVAAVYLKSERATIVKILPRGTLQSVGKPAAEPAVEPSIEKVVFANGVKVLLRKDSRIPLATVQVSLFGGVRHESEKNNGVSALVSRMFLRGTRERDAQGITREINQMGAVIAPFSGRNSIGLTLEVISSALPHALSVMADLFLNPDFPEQELEKEKRLLLAGLKTKEEDPFSWGMRRLMATLFTVHPYRLDPMGYEESVSKLKRENLSGFYKRLLDPRAMVISAVGDFRREDLLSVLEGTFGKLPAPSSEGISVPQEPPLTSIRERVEAAPRREGLIMIGFRGIQVSDPDAATLDLIDAILAGGAGRLFDEVREKRGLAYTVGSFGVHGVDPGAFILYAVTEPAQIQEAKKVLLEEVERLKTVPVPEEELQQAKQGLLGGRRIARQTQGAVAAQIGLDELYGLGYDYSQRYESDVKGVTAQMIQDFSKRVLDSRRCVVIIGQPEEGTAFSGVPDGLAEIVDVGPDGKR